MTLPSFLLTSRGFGTPLWTMPCMCEPDPHQVSAGVCVGVSRHLGGVCVGRGAGFRDIFTGTLVSSLSIEVP